MMILLVCLTAGPCHILVDEDSNQRLFSPVATVQPPVPNDITTPWQMTLIKQLNSDRSEVTLDGKMGTGHNDTTQKVSISS